MQETQLNDDDFIIHNSLKRSKSRRRSILYIGQHPDKTVMEISLGIGLSYANTHGAIMGDGKKYSTEHSLIGMDLVICKMSDNKKVFELTETGKKFFKLLNDHPELFE